MEECCAFTNKATLFSLSHKIGGERLKDGAPESKMRHSGGVFVFLSIPGIEEFSKFVLDSFS